MNALVCEVGATIYVPNIINKDTGQRILDIDRLIITCTPGDRRVLPTPIYSWVHDGTTVVRPISRFDKAVMIDDEFLMSERNALLFMIQPIPLVVTPSLSIVIDFTAYNVSTIVGNLLPGGGMERGDVRTYVLDSIIGEWRCTGGNAFGNDTKTSLVTG